MKLLMVEDNRSVSEMMSMFFQKEQWESAFAYDGDEALEMFNQQVQDWDIVTLDLNLPGKDGMEVAKEIREKSKTVPIIMLTARDSESDQVLGLEYADEYVTKPFSPITLIARIKALYRRSGLKEETAAPKQPAETKKFDINTPNFQLSSATREAYLLDKEIPDLTPKEFDLLKALSSKPKQVFTREQLLQQVWGYDYFGDERTVDAHIKKLRHKIEQVGPQIIQTVWGVGYKFDDSDVQTK
ncbi:MAG: winged helix-turn-helix domain-containing protein [Bombilactobacillus sp.]